MKIKLRSVHPLLVVVFFLQAVWEMTAVEARSTWCSDCQEGDVLYFLLYNTGNINNSGGLCFIFLFILDQISPKSDFFNRLLSILAVNLIFYNLEKNDMPDFPFAVLGTLIFFFPSIIHSLKENRITLEINAYGKDKKV